MIRKVQWNVTFPERWVTVPAKRLFPESKERAAESDRQLSATQEYGVIPQDEFMRLAGRRVVQLNQNKEMRKRVEVGDFVISMRSFQGGLERAWACGGIRSSYVVLRPIESVELGYYQYLFKSTDYIQVLQSTANFIRDGQDMNYQNFILIDLPFPEISEQVAIANFLDHQTARIDALVEEQQRLIELLKEKRQAVISHAVTKGLDPDVPMKDSGVEWLGEVPAHWQVKRIRFVATLNPSKSEVKHLSDKSEVSFIPMEAVGEEGSLDLSQTRPLGEVIDGYTYFSEGDVTFAKITPCFENGKGAIMQGLSESVGFGTTELTVVRPDTSQVTGDYLYRVITSRPFRELGESHMYGAGGQKRVPDDFLRNFNLAWPPISEQATIATFLDHETSRFDILVKEGELGIKLLQERRSALISAAVTGKIDVRGWQPSEGSTASTETAQTEAV